MIEKADYDIDIINLYIGDVVMSVILSLLILLVFIGDVLMWRVNIYKYIYYY